jgi:hypothetical protein
MLEERCVPHNPSFAWHAKNRHRDLEIRELYVIEFAAWARQNTPLLRSHQLAQADLEHIAEEIEAWPSESVARCRIGLSG